MNSDQAPLFSIVIATHDRPRRLHDCLASLAEQDYPRTRYEVVVVDDGSPRPLTPVVEPFEDRMQVRLLRRNRGGCGVARNSGAEAARGEIVAFTDDDCRHTPDWLSRLDEAYRAWPGAMIGGRAINVLPSVYSATTQILVDYLLDWFNASRTHGRYLNAIAVPRDAFLDLGGFDPRLFMSAEDRGFCTRWRATGRRIVFVPDMVIYHAHQLTARSFWRQHFSYGRGAFHFHRVSREDQAAEDGVQPAGFYAGLLLSPFRQSPAARAMLQSGLIVLAQVATFAGWMHERFHAQEQA